MLIKGDAAQETSNDYERQSRLEPMTVVNNASEIPSNRWNNGWDGSLLFKCPHNSRGDFKAVSSIYSVHDNHREDRLFSIKCADIPVPADTVDRTCYWTGWLNSWDQPFNKKCPSNGYVAGLHSYHHNHHEDRRWEMLCCRLERKFTPANSDCQGSGWQNNFDGVLSYDVPTVSGWFMSGMHSYHDNHREDRRYSFHLCKPKTCTITNVEVTGIPRARKNGLRVIGLVTKNNCGPSSAKLIFGRSQKYTRSATVELTKSKFEEISHQAGIKLGGKFDWFSAEASYSFTHKSGNTYSSTNSNTSEISSQISQTMEYTIQGFHPAMAIVTADEYVFDSQWINAKVTRKCGSHISVLPERIVIKARTFENLRPDFFSPIPPYDCSRSQRDCIDNVGAHDILKEKNKVIDDFNSCFSNDPMKGARVISGDVGTWTHHGIPVDAFSVQKLLTWSKPEVFKKNYWLAPDRKTGGEFRLDLRVDLDIRRIILVNTHNAYHRDRGTRAFKVFLSTGAYGPWRLVVSSELPDSRRMNPVPAKEYTFYPIKARYVRFQLVSYWGEGGGLQYFGVRNK